MDALIPNMSPDVEIRGFEPDKLVLKLRVTLSADRDAIDPVVESVMDIIREMKCVDGKESDIELALSEALANAVVHGAKADASKVVECDVACDQNRGMLIVVRDPGTGFDPANVPSPLQGENLYSDHGRGIFLINQLMDEVKFEKNGTEIHMRKF
jgi:serine/threonine-protein kinase RsbW